MTYKTLLLMVFRAEGAAEKAHGVPTAFRNENKRGYYVLPTLKRAGKI